MQHPERPITAASLLNRHSGPDIPLKVQRVDEGEQRLEGERMNKYTLGESHRCSLCSETAEPITLQLTQMCSQEADVF